MKTLELKQMESLNGGIDWESIAGFTCTGVGLYSIGILAAVAGSVSLGFGAIGVVALGVAACAGSVEAAQF